MLKFFAKTFAKTLALAVCGALISQTFYTTVLKAESHGSPNLILILADDLGYGDVSFHGESDVETPNLERLASEGMMLTSMRANCTVCSPTRAALMTGVYPDRAGVPGVIRTTEENSWGYLNPELPTLADRLKQVGYHTAVVGKWHLGLRSPNLPNHRGFDHFHGFLGDMMDDYYSHLREGHNYMRLDDQEIAPEGHATEIFTDWAADYLTQRAAEPKQPFFLYLAYNAPHFPIQPPQEWLEKIRMREPHLDLKRALNVALVEHLDDQIGRLLTKLDELGLRDNTIVAFTSDNGGSLPHSQNNDPWRDGKQSHYDGGLRVPCLLRYPGHVKAGSRSAYQALTFDIGATFLQYAGCDIPGDSDAIGLMNLLEGKPQTDHHSLYFVRREGGRKYLGQAYHALIQDEWKLMRSDPFSPLELYNLKSDPGETRNVIDRERPRVLQMERALMKQIQQGGETAWQPSKP